MNCLSECSYKEKPEQGRPILTKCFWLLRRWQLINFFLTSRRTTAFVVKQLSSDITQFLPNVANIPLCILINTFPAGICSAWLFLIQFQSFWFSPGRWNQSIWRLPKICLLLSGKESFSSNWFFKRPIITSKVVHIWKQNNLLLSFHISETLKLINATFIPINLCFWIRVPLRSVSLPSSVLWNTHTHTYM